MTPVNAYISTHLASACNASTHFHPFTCGRSERIFLSVLWAATQQNQSLGQHSEGNAADSAMPIFGSMCSQVRLKTLGSGIDVSISFADEKESS